MKRIELLVIDPQVDFCDPAGALTVTGAHEDALRLAAMIRRLGSRIDDIHVTLDMHHYYDIAHPVFWQTRDGKSPAPFTLISYDSIISGEFRPADPRPEMLSYVKMYTQALQANGRYLLRIWPPHCLIGTVGSTVYQPIAEALLDWEKANVAMVDYVTKGSNFKTEHYSAVQADVPDSSDPSTMLNSPLIETLRRADVIPVTGQALSHCVAFTAKDIADNFGDDNIEKIVLLTDTSSPVPGFEKEAELFIQEMTARGMKCSTSVDFLK